MTNGTTGTPDSKEIKVKLSWEERVIALFFSWRQKLFPHPSDQRWGPDKKEMVMKTVKTLMRLLPTLFMLGVALTFIGIGTYDSIVKRIKIKARAAQELMDINNELMIINPQLDPTVAPIISNEIKGAADAMGLDQYLIIAIIKYESRCKINAKNPDTGAMGLMQWLVSAQRLRDLGLQEYQVSHIHTNIWEGAKVLWDGFQVKVDKKTGKQVRDGGIKGALFYYNGVTTNIASGNEYAANVLGKYFDMKHRKVAKISLQGGKP